MQVGESNGLSEASVAVIESAKEWQRELEHPFLHTGHLFCSLLQVQSPAAVFLRTVPKVTTESITRQVQACFAAGIINQERAARQVSDVVNEARKLADGRVEPEHLLLALLAHEESVAHQVLYSLLGEKLTRVYPEAQRFFAPQEPAFV